MAAAIDKKIEIDEKLTELDDDIRLEHIEILTRFYLAFESILQYVNELNSFINEVNGGFFIQQTIESILNDAEGKQIFCESLYLYGVMLLILDIHIPGIVRERLMVSYYRYSAHKAHGDSNIDEVCKLVRSTGFINSVGAKRPANYPEEYFKRIPLNEVFIEMVIGRLRSDDIYNQVAVYPLPENKTTALASQASMLFVCLFFSPSTLQKAHRMREIKDKFFADNWIISIYMGITVSLIDEWEPYKAAKSALVDVIDPGHIKEICTQKQVDVEKLIQESRAILKAGALTESSLMNELTNIMNLIRQLNVALRWTMLHTNQTVVLNENKRCKEVRELVIAELGCQPNMLFELLLNTSQLELKVREMIKELLVERESRYGKYKTECESRMQDLSEAFSGTQPLMRIEKNENLQKWFLDIKREIEALEFSSANKSGRKLVQMVRALEEVQTYHNLESNMQVKQLLHETRDYLRQMIHMLNIKDDILVTLQLIGDFSYAWRIVDSFTPIMQSSIKKQPNLVIKLRAAFQKLASALDIPLFRISQAKSDDLESVSRFYSNELIDYVRKVVQIIPKSIFEILAQIIHLQTNVIRELPTKVEKEKLKEYAQLDHRFMVSKLTYSISVFTEGVLMMKKTLVGVIELDPKELLEDGIRIELVKNVVTALNDHLTGFSKTRTLEVQLDELARNMDGYRRSFGYIQDYMNIRGLHIWQEETARVINFYVERECNNFLRNKIQEWQSRYQNSTIPIPILSTDGITFIGTLSKELLRLTDPTTTNYLALSSAWFEAKSHKEVINLKLTSKLLQAVGVAGLRGLDKIYSFMICDDIQQLVLFLQTSLFSIKAQTDQLEAFLKEDMSLKVFNIYSAKFSKILPRVTELILRIGHKQILRRHLGYELNMAAKFSAKLYEATISAFNESLLLDVEKHAIDQSHPLPSVELLSELDEYLLAVGLFEPYLKSYITAKASTYHGTFLAIVVVSTLPKFTFIRNAGELVGKKGDIDGHPFIIGLLTFIRQFDNTVQDNFLHIVCKWLVAVTFLHVG